MPTFTRRAFSKLILAGALTPIATQVAKADGHAKTHTVMIKGHNFQPARLTVAKGDKVVFVNQDGAPHTATGNGFDTGRLNRGGQATLTFSRSGAFDYKCAFHPAMKGRITVS